MVAVPFSSIRQLSVVVRRKVIPVRIRGKLGRSSMTARSNFIARALRGGASTLAIGAMIFAPAAYAQDATTTAQEAEETKPISAQTDPDAASDPAPDAGAIVVTGQRRALRTSQQIKRNADTVVDTITATDIGAFPDKSVAEALQRVPGITVNRFAASSDTAHFSAEPSGVIVRGLPQVRSEFNGRDTFSANSSRGLSWGDVTPELMAGVDTYKNQTAELIEGGIAGSINLRTRVPFDATGQLFQVGANMNYNDLSKRWTPDANVFYSNRWDTSFGEVGIMANAAFSRVVTASHGIQYGRMGVFRADNPATTAVETNLPFVGRDAAGASMRYGPELAFIPSNVAFLDNEYDRKRRGFALAGQWKSPDDRILATVQFNRSVYENSWNERVLGAPIFDLWQRDVNFRLTPGGLNDERIPQPAPGTPNFTFDEDGNFERGTFLRPQNNDGSGDAFWWGNPGTNVGFGVNESGAPMFNACYSWQGNGCTLGYANEIYTQSRSNENRNMTQDIGLNLKWEATDRLRFNFDGQYVDSEVDNYDISVQYNSFANVSLDATGDFPRMSFGTPTNINQSPGGLSNPNNYYVNNVMDHFEESEGNQYAFRADAEYDLNTDWMDSIKFGARHANRKQEVKWSTYNWANVANTWTEFGSCPHPYFNLDSTSPGSCGTTNFAGYPEGLYEVRPFGQDFFGGNQGAFPFVPLDALRDRRADEYSRDVIGVGEFRPICTRPAELDDSCFLNNEIADVSEKTLAAYAMLRWGGPSATIGGMAISGNVGLRFVRTKNESNGFLSFPVNDYDFNECDGVIEVGEGQPTPPPGTPVDPAHCFLSPEELIFINGSSIESTRGATHRHFLPSFNAKLDITDKWLLRFAASKAMSRPDIGLLKNFVNISAGLPGTSGSDERWVRNAAGEVIGVNPDYTASAYNPELKPTTAWQFDLSLENYFANVGSFSFAVFHKRFQDYIQYGTFNQDVTLDGVTRNVRVRGPANGKGAKISGFEVAYQRFFDFLPDPWNGLGIQTNYTQIRNKGVPNSNLSIVGTTGDTTDDAGRTVGSSLNPGSLEGLSKHSANLVGMYEKNGLALRLAYNWRSKYLVSAVDCCVGLPVWQKAAGYLDGSIRYSLTKNVELSVQGSNLLNTKTRLLQQVSDGDSPEGEVILTPNAWFQQDRRIVFGARVRFGQ